MLIQFTIHKIENTIIRKRKRPVEFSLNFMNKRVISELFESNKKNDKFRHILISQSINDYNHHMNEMNVTQQFRSLYNTHRITRKN